MVHGDHLQRVTVHAAQVVHQAAAGSRLHHVVGHSLTDLHRLQQVGDKQEFGEEVLTLRHGGCVARWMEGGEEEEQGEGKEEEEEEAPTTAVRTTWKLDGEKGSGYVISQQRTVENNSIDWWEIFSGDSPSLLIETQDTT